MKKQRWIVLMSLAFSGLIFSAGQTELMAEPMDIKITTVQLRQQQMGVGVERLAKYAQEKLKDKIRLRTYPAAQLYTGQEEVHAIISGELQMAYIIGSALELIDPSQEMIKLPFLFPSIDVSYKILEGPVGKKLFAKVDQKGVAMLGMVSSGNVAISNNRRPIKTVEDCKDLKMRSFGRMGASTLRSLGALGIVTASEETYSALQQGVIDGATSPSTVFLARKYYDVQKFVTDGGMLNATFAFIIANKAWWNNLPADIRNGLSEAIQRLIKEQRAEIEVENKKLFEAIAAKGCQVYYLSPAEQLNWKKALQPVYQEFAPIVGADLVREAQQEAEKLSKAGK
jgi:C4-dicarboxylate-binding protein DctP